jgi:nucleoside-diphosphate-sugar epimerase
VRAADPRVLDSVKASLSGADAVVHLAARVHVMRDGAANRLAEFRRVNTEATLELAREAVRHGVRRFIFLSTVKVNPLPNSAPRLTARTVRPARFTRPAGRRQATATRYAPRGRHASSATGAAWRRRSRDTAARRFSRCEIWAIRSRTGGRIA